MENNVQNQNNSNATSKEKKLSESLIPNKTVDSRITIANLDQKRDELLSGGKINNEVSGYLDELGEKDNSPPARNPITPPEERKNLKQNIVRTYKSDAEEAVRRQRASSISIALAEQKKRRGYQPIEESADAPKLKKRVVLILSLLFVLAGIGAFNFNYIKEKVAPAPKNQTETHALIMADSNKEINLNETEKKDLNNLLSESLKSSSVAKNSIQNIYITENNKPVGKEKPSSEAIGSKKFLSLINSRMPDPLLRSLMPEYMLGIRSSDGNQPFIILKTDSYENAFAGMLSWEKNMADDLSALFPGNSMSSMQEASATTEQILGRNKNFEDILVKNKDARALKDGGGNIFLIYSLPDKETVIITSNAGTLAELFDRIIRSRTIR